MSVDILVLSQFLSMVNECKSILKTDWMSSLISKKKGQMSNLYVTHLTIQSKIMISRV